MDDKFFTKNNENLRAKHLEVAFEKGGPRQVPRSLPLHPKSAGPNVDVLTGVYCNSISQMTMGPIVNAYPWPTFTRNMSNFTSTSFLFAAIFLLCRLPNRLIGIVYLSRWTSP